MQAGVAGLRREVRVLKCEARYYRAMHRKAVAREQRLKETLSGVRTKLKELRQRLRGTAGAAQQQEREARPARHERRRGGAGAAPTGPATRVEWAWPARPLSAAGAGGTPRAGAERALLSQVWRGVPRGRQRGLEVLEIEVRAHRRVIKRQRYHCSCGCAGAPRVVTAPAPSRLIPKGIWGSRSGCRCCSTSIAITDRPIGCWKT